MVQSQVIRPFFIPIDIANPQARDVASQTKKALHPYSAFIFMLPFSLILWRILPDYPCAAHPLA